MFKIKSSKALEYHAKGRPGKIEVKPTTEYSTQHDLSLAYSPGVAEPCLEIKKNPNDVYKYTTKGNLVAVISNGTAVLGLGDIGPEASKPVMEGKGLLFKIFADIDVFDIEVDEKDIDKFVQTVKAISPTFGGINLEDIKAPECFEIEERLKKELDIPVMHDDQHGTAIISAAGLLNALELQNKNIEDVKVVVSGAGASAVSCTKLYISLGVNPKNVVLCDSKGVVNNKRDDLNYIKKQFITERDIDSLEEAIVDADVFLGLSIAGILSKEMLASMAKDPIVFAMANPDPEISYDDAMATRDDLIFATGRSDYPNQVNNVLGFPFIFRGALDVRASAINEEMKKAAVYALSNLAKEAVPEDVNTAYKAFNIVFGKDYIIPKPLDHRLITAVAPAVAKAAMESGVAREPIEDWDDYKNQLSKRLGYENALIRSITEKAKQNPKRVVFAEANNLKMLKAAQVVLQEGIAKPILLGNLENIKKAIKENNLELLGVDIIDLRSHSEKSRRKRYAELLFEKRQRKGLTYDEAFEKMYDRHYFGVMMVETGEADAFVSGISSKFIDTINPAREIIGTKKNVNTIAGMYVLMTKKGPFFMSDTTVNIQPSIERFKDITLLTAEEVRKFNIEPVIAMVSYSNFGSAEGEGSPQRIREAIKMLHEEHPDLIVDGEIQANFALNKKLRQNKFPFAKFNNKDVNTLIFPNASSGSITYKTLQEIGDVQTIGPILIGIKKPIHLIQIGSSVREIVNMVTLSVVDAQCIENDNCH
ncbi:MAG: NADP-dependent malic enzyme [Bacteroidetes bacterium]|jgi:malate dehydrogenase (oxaloacetate-decarboxylating)(NADP+)|nr:NADP-dependent malic enzyme [Bacteroidota bacterium]MBT6686123.1 NADP-dependent malic enzyme [Bacteroidota bacterium]MBT7142338.1 NADP-dependent malic enzyme [Bacteroidota bacterium]MBT7490291.1 NADP-dependent malic enzyme [Bacteroidota bacterium]